MMNEFGATIFLAALFVLRCVAPLLITMGVCYLMNRLLDRWTEEDALGQQAAPGRPVPVFGGDGEPASQPVPSLLSLPCWLFNNCDETKRRHCPGYNKEGIPCWQARLMAEGKLPDTCPTCPRYIAAQAVA